MQSLKLVGGPALCALVGPLPERIAFYAKVMGLAPDRIGEDQVLDLGPDEAEALALARAVMEGYGQVEPALLRQRLGPCGCLRPVRYALLIVQVRRCGKGGAR